MRIRLHEWRSKRFLTMRELAEKADVSLDTVNRLELGGNAHPTTVRKLAAALNVEPGELVEPASSQP